MLNNRYDPFSLDPSEKKNTLPPLSAMDLASKRDSNKKVKYRCRVFNVADPAEREEFEELMTKVCSFNPNLEYHNEQSTFSKDGDYLVALRWFEYED